MLYECHSLCHRPSFPLCYCKSSQYYLRHFQPCVSSRDVWTSRLEIELSEIALLPENHGVIEEPVRKKSTIAQDALTVDALLA